MRAPCTTESPTAPAPITATRAPGQTWAVSSTDITPVATAQPIRQAWSTGSSRGTIATASSCTTVRVAKVPVRRTGVRSVPSARCNRPGAAGGRLHWRGSPRLHGAHVPHERLPADHDPVAGRHVRDALADRLDDAGALVAEQHRERVPPAVLLDHVQVAVADAGRLDLDEHLVRPRRVDDDLLEGDLAGRGENYAAVSQDRSSSRIDVPPASASVRSISAIRFSVNASTPRGPTDGERVRVRAPEQNRVGAEGHRLHHVGGAADAAVHQHDRLGQRVPYLDERIEGRDGAVDLAAAMVRHDHAVDAVLEGAARVGGREHSLDEQRQLRPLPEPVEVVPGETEIREGREHRRGRGEQILGRRLVELCQEHGIVEELPATLAADERQVRVAQVARPPAERERVERDDDRAVARLLGARDEAGADVAVRDPVELEPARATGLGDLFERMGRGARDDHRHT